MSDTAQDFIESLLSPLLSTELNVDRCRVQLQRSLTFGVLTSEQQTVCIQTLQVVVSSIRRGEEGTQPATLYNIISMLAAVSRLFANPRDLPYVRITLLELLEQLLITALASRSPRLWTLLWLLGAVALVRRETIAGTPESAAGSTARFRFRLIPLSQFQHWDWRTLADAMSLDRRSEARMLASWLYRVCTALPTLFPSARLSTFVQYDDDASDLSSAIRIAVNSEAALSTLFRVRVLGTELFASVEIAGGGEFVIPFGNYQLRCGAQSTTGVVHLLPEVRFSGLESRVRCGIFIEGPLSEQPVLRLAPGVDFRVQSVTVGGGFEALSTQPFSPFAELATSVELSLDPESGSPLLRALLGRRVSFNTSLNMSYSRTTGLLVNAAASLEVFLQVRARFGGVAIDGIALSARAASNPAALSLAARVDASVAVGFARLTARGFGASLEWMDSRGSLGSSDLSAEFASISSVGLQLNSPIATGGGELSVGSGGSYSGSMSLTIRQLGIAASASMLVRSNGSYSIVASLFASFPGIPIGMGFSLSGVGGLVGIHRTFVLPRLRALLMAANSSPLLPSSTSSSASLQQVFAPSDERYVVGPIVQISFGPPAIPIAEIVVALVLELPLPLRFVLAGAAEMLLPNRSTAVVELHMRLLGIVDPGQKEVSVDASLNDSRIGPLELFGDLAFRLGWGEQPYFLLSIGGFNPHFQAPSNFPTLRRLTLGYTAPGGLVRLRIESYFAITSNTLQLGARVEVQVRVEVAAIDGMLAFDALVIFSPFSFRIDFLASLSVTVFGAKLLAIHLEGTIKGPKPWHVTGKARLSVLFIEAAVDVDVKFGGEPSLEELPSVDPTDRLLEALRAAPSWKGELVAGVARPVSLSDASSSENPLFDPVGVPAVRQTIVPLNRKLDRFAEGRIGGPGRYDVRAARVGSAPATHRPMHEMFAAAQFEQMSDAEKLSRPSFEKMDAGALVASDAISVGPKTQGAGLYEQIKLGGDETPTTTSLPSEQLVAGSRNAASSLRGLRIQGSDRFTPALGTPPRVVLADEFFVATSRDSLRPASRATPETAGAASALVQLLAEESGGASLFQVAPAFEATGGEGR